MRKILLFSLYGLLASLSCVAQNWLTAGNALPAAGGKLGSTGASPVIFITNGIERARFAPTTGFLGIGTTAPAQTLQVNSPSSTNPLAVQVAGITKLKTYTNGGTSIGADLIPPLNGLYVHTIASIGSGAGILKTLNVFGDQRILSNSTALRYLEFYKPGAAFIDYRFLHTSAKLEVQFSTNDFGSATTVLQVGKAGDPYQFVVTGKALANSWSVPSDSRLKKDVKDINSAMEIINKLKPKTYLFKTNEYPSLQLPGNLQYGLVAQEVETVIPEIVSTDIFSMSENSEKKEIKGINYIELIPLLIKAAQEQQEQIEKQNKKIEQLNQLIRNLKGGTLSGVRGSLGQNIPNPVRSITNIQVNFPDGEKNGELVVTDMMGRKVKVISIPSSGTVKLDASPFVKGVYNYSLMVNGQILETRKLTVVK